MSIDIDIEIEFDHTQLVSNLAQARASNAVRKATKDIEASYKGRMPGGGGRVYKRRGKVHQAAAPGQPPAIDTSDLINSIGSRMEGSYTGVVEATAAHAVMQELGTRKMAARPALRPAVEEVKPAFEAALKRIADI